MNIAEYLVIIMIIVIIILIVIISLKIAATLLFLR